MYTQTEILCPYFQEFTPEVQQLVLDELFHSHQSPSSSMIESSFIYEHELGGQGDLFQAPELVFHEPIASLDDPLMEASSISMTPFVDQNFEPTQDHNKVIDFENELFDKTLYDDILVSSSAETHQINEIMEDNTRVQAMVSEVHTDENQLMNESAFQKSVSTGSLHSSMAPPLSAGSSFLGFEATYEMRRAFSEGDIKALGNANLCFIGSSFQWPRVIHRGCSFEERQKKLSRYKIKKLKRNFGRKIKYACRKTLADSQPRIRGRFAKTRDTLSCQMEKDANKCIDMKDW